MADISLIQYARLLGSNTVIGMAEKVGLTPPPPPISVRNLVDLAGRIILPLAPVDLQPQNGAHDVSNTPSLFFRDPGAGTPAAAGQFEFLVTQNNVIVDPSHKLTGPAVTSSPLTPPGVKWLFPLPSGEVTLTVWGQNKAGEGPASTSTFTVSSPLPPPPPVSPTIEGNIDSNDVVTLSGKNFMGHGVVNFQITVTGAVLGDGGPDFRSQFASTTADGTGSFSKVTVSPKGFGQATFQDGSVAFVIRGEGIAVVAKNQNVNEFTPGPGVSNIIRVTAPSTV
jgi:hypothetical protein